MTDKVNLYRLEVLKEFSTIQKDLEFKMRMYAKDFVESEEVTDRENYFLNKMLLGQLGEVEKICNSVFVRGEWKES